MRNNTKTARTTIAKTRMDPPTGGRSAESAGSMVAQILRPHATETKTRSDVAMSVTGAGLTVVDRWPSAQVLQSTEDGSRADIR